MAVDQYCLKWNNFQSSILTAFESLQTTEDLADVTLTCEGLSIKAHKIILSACSPYFRTVFKENPCPHPIVILKDVLQVDLIAILNFMYHGEVLICQDQLSSFLQTAEILQVSGLVSRSYGNDSPTSLVRSSDKTDSISSHGSSPKRFKSTKSMIKQHGPVESRDDDRALEENVEVAVCVKKEADEDSDGDASNNNNNIEENVGQSSILEAALELKDTHASILERSLTALNKSPSASEQETMEIEKQSIKHKLSDSSWSSESGAADVSKSVKLREMNLKHVESDMLPHNLKAQLLDIQPHHSSQCGNCPHCGKVYSNQSALKYHVRLVHSDLTNMYCCHLCPESFDYREGYKKHMVEAHSIRN